MLGAVASAASVDFVREVRPIFEKHCTACHGEKKQKSGLRLDVKITALKGGDQHAPNIIVGKSEESPLIQFVMSADTDERMPPKGERLTPAEVATLARWIDEGAAWPDGVDTVKLADPRAHWAFKPVAKPGPPQTKDTEWPRNDVDRFILARLERDGLRPASAADRVAWLRRVTLDLTGLPPTPEQVDVFQNDTAGDAHERTVDALLASPRYGERWAQHWLDVVRYADTHGFEVNTERPNAWPYRDYVIRAFNSDTPYDRFIREQIGGDALGEDAATGFLVTASVLLDGQIGKDAPSRRLARQDSLDEIVTNVSQTFLGLSVGCARCHDHKFDPITQRDYHAMQAFFAGVEYEDREMRTPEVEAKRAEEKRLTERMADIEQKLARLAPVTPEGENEETKRLIEQRKTTEREISAAQQGRRVFAGKFRAPDTIHLLSRGDPEQPKEEMLPAVLSALGELKLPADSPEQQRRTALADWIASAQNPLTARVMVNRIWQGHFGTGLVETPSDFGLNGMKPSHPELLDWLAGEFIRCGWSVKHMHRLIVLSATYRQASAANSVASEKDADVRMLWRFPPHRCEAEVIRDAMLAASGTLDLKMYGRGFNLFDQRGGLSGFKPVESFTGDGLRRMIYAHKVRREREAVFGAFDCPDAGQSTARRRESTTPIQALNLFNSRFTIDAAEALAARARREVGDDISKQIHRAYQLTLSRSPTTDELADTEPAVREHGLAALCRALFNSNEFLFLP